MKTKTKIFTTTLACLLVLSLGFIDTHHAKASARAGALTDADESYLYFGYDVARGDFNGDGYDDLAVGTPSDNAGIVYIFAGSATGLGNPVVLDQSPAGSNEAGDYFGSALASGDFNGDGYDDLAVGTPFEAVESNTVVGAGAVFIFEGSSSGLGNPVAMTQEPGGWNEDYDHFGGALASGDFDGDGYDDLAVGTPDEAVENNTIEHAGIVYIFEGSETGLGNAVALDQSPAGWNEGWDFFGDALASGDFDGDGYDDLAVGTPWEDVENNTVYNAGAVFIFKGSETGLGNPVAMTQEPAGSNEWNDNFGYALASGDFDGDGYDDLAVGTPHEDVENNMIYEAGAVFVFAGSETGLGNAVWITQEPGGWNEDSDHFGKALASGDFDGDGYDDLAVGALGEDVENNTKIDAGAVFIFTGSETGLGNMVGMTQESLGRNEDEDYFGCALASGDFDGDGYDDLAVGAPWEDIESEDAINVGAVFIFNGSSSSLEPATSFNPFNLE